MTTKTIKTILFAGLIAAMILPFSGMQSVDAAHENGEIHEEDGTNAPDDAEYDATKRTDDSPGTHMPDGAQQGFGENRPDGDSMYGDVVEVNPNGGNLPDGADTNGENMTETPMENPGSHKPSAEPVPIEMEN